MLGAPHPSAAMHISSHNCRTGVRRSQAKWRDAYMPEYRHLGIPAKSVNYFYGNMKDADFSYGFLHGGILQNHQNIFYGGHHFFLATRSR
jgi:hypothetical protein